MADALAGRRAAVLTASGNGTDQPAAPRVAPVRPEPSTRNLPVLLERCMAEELYRQGVHFLNSGEYDQAVERFHSAAEIDPSLLAARSDMAGVYCLQQKYKEALAIYTRILDTDPQYTHALRGAALCHASLKQYDPAKKMLHKLIDQDRRDSRSWMELGDVSFLDGSAAEARQCWEKAAQVDPTAAETIRQANLRLSVYGVKAPGPTAQAK
jgi:tetratricopeptide (TPR) repeat protein